MMQCRRCRREIGKNERCVTLTSVKKGHDPVTTYSCLPCYHEDQADAYRSTGQVTTSLWLELRQEVYEAERGGEAASEMAVRVCADMELVETAVKDFEAEVWFAGGLQKLVRADRGHGMSVTWNGIRMMLFATGGSVSIQLDEADQRVTVIVDERSLTPTMGIQGIDAKPECAIGLIKGAMVMWKNGARPERDGDVRPAGLW